MNMNKKLLALLLAMMMLIGLAGCGENNDPTPGTTDPTKATDPATPGTDGLTLHENTFFKVGYDEEAGWSLAEDDFDLSDSGGHASVRVLDGDNNTEILVEIEAYETDASSFRESLRFNGPDQKAYVEGTLETVSRRETIGKVLRAVDTCLTDQERQVIRLRYGLGGVPPKRQREVADATGISRSYVSHHA